MVVLDTHTLVWWATSDPSLSESAQAAIDSEGDRGVILISTISAWEIAMLVKHGRLVLSMDASAWLRAVEAIPAARFVPVDVDIATRSVDLPGEFHKDPPDRIIVATARKYSVPLITKDEKIRAYSHVRSIW